MELKRQTYAGNKRSHRSGRSIQKNNLNCLYRNQNLGIRKGKRSVTLQGEKAQTEENTAGLKTSEVMESSAEAGNQSKR